MDVGTCVYFELFDQVPEKLKKLRQMGFTSCQLISWVPETYTLDKADTMKNGWRNTESHLLPCGAATKALEYGISMTDPKPLDFSRSSGGNAV